MAEQGRLPPHGVEGRVLMAYSNRKLANDPTLLPPIQEYMTWVEVPDYGHQLAPDGTRIRTYTPTGEGKLRHYYSLADAKRGLSWIGSKSSYRQENAGIFTADWALYRWDFEKGQWIELYAGKTGERRDDNRLFKRRLKADEKKHPIDHANEQAAIRSILAAVRDQADERSNQLLESA